MYHPKDPQLLMSRNIWKNGLSLFCKSISKGNPLPKQSQRKNDTTTPTRSTPEDNVEVPLHESACAIVPKAKLRMQAKDLHGFRSQYTPEPVSRSHNIDRQMNGPGNIVFPEVQTIQTMGIYLTTIYLNFILQIGSTILLMESLVGINWLNPRGSLYGKLSERAFLSHLHAVKAS